VELYLYHPYMPHGMHKDNFNYMSLVRPILEYGAACWDPYTEGKINALDCVQRKAAKFANLTNISEWETLAEHRTIARLGAHCKAYTGEWAWKATGVSLQRP
jgi:hypothetical protein